MYGVSTTVNRWGVKEPSVGEVGIASALGVVHDQVFIEIVSHVGEQHPPSFTAADSVAMRVVITEPGTTRATPAIAGATAPGTAADLRSR